jgi:tetratricopeptide (TPR) repeat protein
MQLSGKEPNFHETRSRSNPYRMMFWTVLIVLGAVLIRGYEKGSIQPLFLATVTPTRTTNSFALEGETHFKAGDLEKAIIAFQAATRLDPNNAQMWAEMARIQAYSSNMLTTNEEQAARLQDALASVDKAVALSPDDSTVHAIRAFVLDWNANPVWAANKVDAMLTEAEQEAVRAITLDNANTLALAYYAEILNDQSKLQQASSYIQQAMQQDSSLMDVHRIQGNIHETMGNYNLAIQEYKKAVEIAPNISFLYIRIGKIYRFLQLFPQALEYFEKAARQNEQLGIRDPIPYLAIAITYAQDGQFIAAARNVRKALQLNPSSPDVYAQLGMLYHKSRNYEGAIPAFECAINGCTPEQSCEVRQCDAATEPALAIKGLKLTSDTVPYYYTFGSVLSGLHRPGDEYCTQALVVFQQVRSQFASDPSIMGIVKAGEDICSQ